MNLQDLKTVVDFITSRLKSYQKPEDINVLITLSESSMGARASSELKYVGLGSDWEHGQLRLEPSKALVTKGNSLHDVKQVIYKQHEGKNVYVCPRCVQKISKQDNYCRHCSQKLK